MTNAQIQDVAASLQYVATLLEAAKHTYTPTMPDNVEDILIAAEKHGCDFTVTYTKGKFHECRISVGFGGECLIIKEDGSVHVTDGDGLRPIDDDVAKQRIVIFKYF